MPVLRQVHRPRRSGLPVLRPGRPLRPEALPELPQDRGGSGLDGLPIVRSIADRSSSGCECRRSGDGDRKRRRRGAGRNGAGRTAGRCARLGCRPSSRSATATSPAAQPRRGRSRTPVRRGVQWLRRSTTGRISLLHDLRNRRRVEATLSQLPRSSSTQTPSLQDLLVVGVMPVGASGRTCRGPDLARGGCSRTSTEPRSRLRPLNRGSMSGSAASSAGPELHSVHRALILHKRGHTRLRTARLGPATGARPPRTRWLRRYPTLLPQFPQKRVSAASSAPHLEHFETPSGVPQLPQNFSLPTGLPQLGHSVARALTSPENTF